MSNYIFIGSAERFYPNILTANGSLVAAPGDVMEFDNPPTDGLWVETEAAPTEIPFRPWPPLSTAKELVSVPVAEANVPVSEPVIPTIFG